jgi:hypothetical protein
MSWSRIESASSSKALIAALIFCLYEVEELAADTGTRQRCRAVAQTILRLGDNWRGKVS